MKKIVSILIISLLLVATTFADYEVFYVKSNYKPTEKDKVIINNIYNKVKDNTKIINKINDIVTNKDLMKKISPKTNYIINELSIKDKLVKKSIKIIEKTDKNIDFKDIFLSNESFIYDF